MAQAQAQGSEPIDEALLKLTDLAAVQALLAETVAAERALDAELEALLAKRVVRLSSSASAPLSDAPRRRWRRHSAAWTPRGRRWRW